MKPANINKNLFGDDITLTSTKAILWVLALAVFFRIVILLLNLHWDHLPHWGFLPRTALALAWSDFGIRPLPSGFYSLFKISSVEAMDTWFLNDRGLIFLFVLIQEIFGHVTYTYVQVFHLLLDALMIVPVMWIAKRIAGPKGALAAGVAYALFLPQAQMAVSPDYNSWLGCAMIVMTWITAMLAEAKQRKQLFILFGLLIAANFISNEFRSIVALFSFGAAGWLWLVGVGVHRTVFLPAVRWKPISLLVIAGVAVLLLSASTNFIVRGEYSPVRSTFGHAFFTGVGQYSNPLGMRDDDAAPVEWYARETGKKDTNNGMDPAYNSWLNMRAKEFISDYPVLYGSMVLRRALRIIFPNMAFTLVTDLPSYTRLPRQQELVEMRKSMVVNNGWLSMTTFVQLIKNDPAYVFGLVCRILLMILLPIGLFSAIWLARARAVAVFACFPLAYGLLTLSFVYVTPPVVTGVHAAVLAVSASGLYLLSHRIKGWFCGLRDKIEA